MAISLDDEFYRAMLNIYDAAAELDYRPIRFLQMVHEHGGVAAAKRLLSGPVAQSGLTRGAGHRTPEGRAVREPPLPRIHATYDRRGRIPSASI